MKNFERSKKFYIGAAASWMIGGLVLLGGLAFTVTSYFLALAAKHDSFPPAGVFLYLIPFALLSAVLIGAGYVLHRYGKIAAALEENAAQGQDENVEEAKPPLSVTDDLRTESEREQ